MNSIITNRVKARTDINDEVIVGNFLASSVGVANAYLNATMGSTTPELRAMLSSGLTEVITDNTALNNLAVKKEWKKPYDAPTQQLSDMYEESIELDLQ
jgi:spore coat protein CotF